VSFGSDESAQLAEKYDVAPDSLGCYFGTMRAMCVYIYIGTVRAHAFSEVRTRVYDVYCVIVIFKSANYLYII
jgi:hypothetical protein